jgi:hypothetical protein
MNSLDPAGQCSAALAGVRWTVAVPARTTQVSAVLGSPL